MSCPSNWAISFSRCLKAISSSELAVFIVCCLGVESVRSNGWYIDVGQVSSQEIIGKVHGKSLAVNPWKSQVEPMWHQSGLGQRWAGNWNTTSIDWCLCNTTSCSCVQGSHCFLVNRALLDASAYVLLESNAAVAYSKPWINIQYPHVLLHM